MLSREDNELLTRIGPGTPMGNLMRQYWQPVLLGSELPEPDGPPLRVRALGEDLIAFRDSAGRVGLLGANRSEEHTSELQSQSNLVCRLLLEKKKKKKEVEQATI